VSFTSGYGDLLLPKMAKGAILGLKSPEEDEGRLKSACLEERMKSSPEIEFGRTAVLVLDVQNDIVAATPDVEPVLDNMQRVLAAVRGRGLPITYVTVSFREDYADAPWKTHPLYQMVREYKMVLTGTPGGTIHPTVAPHENEPVFNKTCVNAFVTTRLQQHLKILDVHTLIVMGLWTNFVVEATTRHAADIGYRVVILSDCCASNSLSNHDFAMREILPNFATITDSPELVRKLGSL
jgi:nicotinamidase-related amidase